MLVDSHCHLDMLDLAEFGGEIGNALHTAVDSGVEHFLCVSVDLARWAAMRDLVRPFENVSLTVGVHPSHQDDPLVELDELLELASDPAVVGIGETGLDYHYGAEFAERQRASFRRHVKAARLSGKPLVVHTRSAREDTLQILVEEGAQEIGGVLHCFTEDWGMAEAAMELGFYISFSGIVTFRNAKALQDVARRVPLERVMLETDAPYLAPVPFRGKPNHPARVRQVAEFVAGLRGLDLPTLALATTANYDDLFGRRPSHSLASSPP